MTRPPLVRIASDWNLTSLLNQTPGGSGLWDGIQFTRADVPECDFLILCNTRKLEPVATRCPPEHVWAIMQEPYLPGLFDWLVEAHEPYARVYTHHVPNNDPRYIPSAPYVPWHAGLTYDELIAAPIPEKSRGVSWILSNLSLLPGHQRRNRLRRALQREPGLVDIYGRGIRPIARKWDALAPYRFALAIENATGPYLWTEKIADCFLSWTVPLYHGCTNLEDYFPAESFIRIDIDDPPGVAARIRQLLASDEWERRLPAIELARRRILNEHAFFPFFAQTIRACDDLAAPKADIVIPSYRPLRTKHRARYVQRLLRERNLPQLAHLAINAVKYTWWFRS